MIIPSDFIFVNSISRNMHKRFMDFFKAVVIMTVETKNKAAPLKRGEIRKQAKTLISSRFKDSGQTGYK